MSIESISDDDLWHIACVVNNLNSGSLFNISQHECVTEIRAAFMDPDAGRAFIIGQISKVPAMTSTTSDTFAMQDMVKQLRHVADAIESGKLPVAASWGLEFEKIHGPIGTPPFKGPARFRCDIQFPVAI
jgi:hypothetical protein